MASPTKRRRAGPAPEPPAVAVARVADLHRLPAESTVQDIRANVVWRSQNIRTINLQNASGRQQTTSVFSATLADASAFISLTLWRQDAEEMGRRLARVFGDSSLVFHLEPSLFVEDLSALADAEAGSISIKARVEQLGEVAPTRTQQPRVHMELVDPVGAGLPAVAIGKAERTTFSTPL